MKLTLQTAGQNGTKGGAASVGEDAMAPCHALCLEGKLASSKGVDSSRSVSTLSSSSTAS